MYNKIGYSGLSMFVLLYNTLRQKGVRVADDLLTDSPDISQQSYSKGSDHKSSNKTSHLELGHVQTYKDLRVFMVDIRQGT